RSGLFDAAHEARVVFELIIEPIIVRRQADQHPDRFPVAGDDDLLAFGFAQKPRQVVLDSRASERVIISEIYGSTPTLTGLPTVISLGDLGRAAQGSRAQAPTSRCRSAPSRGRRRFRPPRSPERHERWRCRGSTGPSRNRERAIP